MVERTNASIIVFCETKLANINKVKKDFPTYDFIHRFVKSGKGGIVIGVKRNIFGSFINVTSTKNENILVGRLSHGDLSLIHI